MSINTTRYLKNVLLESLHPIIPFKDENFVSFSKEDFLRDKYDINNTHPLCELLKSDEYKKLFEKLPKEQAEKTQIVEIKCVVSYKTLSKKFFEQERMKQYIPELTGVYYFPFMIIFTRISENVKVEYSFDKDETPWYARNLMSPKYLNTSPTVASVESVDKYKSDTTELRAKIDTWQDYLKYCDDMFNETADLSLEYEKKLFVFRCDIDKSGIIDPIVSLYETIEETSKHNLYENFIDLDYQKTNRLIANEWKVLASRFTTRSFKPYECNSRWRNSCSQRTAQNRKNHIASIGSGRHGSEERFGIKGSAHNCCNICQ